MKRKRKTVFREYEAIFIYGTSNQAFETGLNATKNVFQENKAEILKEEDMGQKKLAYEIKKHKDGRYYLFRIKTKGEAINKMNKIIYRDEGILKHIFIKQEYTIPRKFKKL